MINVKNLSAHQQHFLHCALEKAQPGDTQDTRYSVSLTSVFSLFGISQAELVDFANELIESNIEVDGKTVSIFAEIDIEYPRLEYRLTEDVLPHKEELLEKLWVGNEIGEKMDILAELDAYYEDFGIDYESCWQTTDYDGQYCPLCPHRMECGGYEDRD